MAGHRVGGGEPVGERGRSVAEERFDELDKRRLRSDFLSQVREVCRLHLAKDPLTRDAEIEELEEVDGVRFDHLVVSYHRGPWPKRLLVGAYEGSVGSEDVDRFRSAICDRHNVDEPELVYRGSLAANEVVDQAERRGVWLRPFSEYQQVWDNSRYLRKQTEDLLADTDYPLDLHVDKRWAPLGEDEPRNGTAASRILDWLDTAEPRFVLVLGDFGTGKTYLGLRTWSDFVVK